MFGRTDRPGPRRGAPRGRPPRANRGDTEPGFGELFRGLGSFLDLLGALAEEGGEISQTRDVHGPGGTRGVYGFSVRVGVGGAPTVERFGNIRATERGTEVSEVREPLVDVFDEDEQILVVAELPGVTAEGIRVEVHGDVLNLSAEGPDRKYAREVSLPGSIDPASVRHSYQNGILEIRAAKAAGRA